MNNFLINNWQKPKLKSLRDGFGKAILSLGQQHQNLMVLTADLASSTRVFQFSQDLPEQFLQIGVAEQNMVGIAAGLSLVGKIPFCCSFASFLTARAWEQIRVCVAVNNLPVKLVGSHAGLSHQSDGFTVQGTEDICLMRVLPNMSVLYPADFNQVFDTVVSIFNYQGPCYLRLTREPTPLFINSKAGFKLGKAQVLKPGKDITIISAGPLLYQVLQAAKKLEKQKISCEVINLHTIKPIDSKTILNSIKKTKLFLTVEDHQIQGGLGSAVAELIVKNNPVKGEFLGLNNQFSQSARSYDQLLEKYQLSSTNIMSIVKKLCQR